MEKFKGESIINFFDTFKTDLDCLEYLATIKWHSGFNCIKCNHDKFTIRKANLARDCNRCHHKLKALRQILLFIELSLVLKRLSELFLR